MDNKWYWQFPSYINLPINNEDQLKQLLKINEEIYEVSKAWNEWLDDYTKQDEYVIELMDVIHACETCLREFEQSVLDRCKGQVIKKNEDRGYYDRED